VRAAARRLARRVRSAAWLVTHGRVERQARAALGMPARHPERVTAELTAGQETWLAATAGVLWPAGEYVEIITGTWEDW
jgi:hypothetical protein